MKYLENLIIRFKELKKGIEMNNKIVNDKISDLSVHIDELEKMDDEIESLKKKLSETLKKARLMRDKKQDEILIIEKKIIGIHADDNSKLKDYNITLKYTRK